MAAPLELPSCAAAPARGGPAQLAVGEVGLLHLQLGASWPTYMHYILRSAAANHAITFYFLGPDLDTSACLNCHNFALDEMELLERIQSHLKIDKSQVKLDARKLCDLKPMWPALFPELSSRHAWIGYSDYDILYGDLMSEVAELQETDEILVLTYPLTRIGTHSTKPNPLHAPGSFGLFPTAHSERKCVIHAELE